MFSYSFMPNRRWFIFNVETGETVVKGLSSPRSCRSYMQLNGLLS
jgi:hypothetical protein